MMASHWIFVVAVFILQLVLFYPCIEASGIAEIRFEKFSNPTGKLFSGKCCDFKNFWSYDCAPCDHQFVVCLGNIPESSDMNSCEFGKVTTGKLKSNQIEFIGDIGGVANPIKLKFDTWPGFMKIKINTLDIDGLDTFDFVDHYEYHYFTPVLKRREDSTPLTLNLVGSSTSLKLVLRVHCDEFSYGPTCEIVCIPRDDEEGHYSCDGKSGEKRCLKGWTGDNCTDNRDDCKEHQCQSGATCQDGIDRYTCLCPLGRTGQYCEGEINECASSPCLNGGSCFDELASFRCSCTASYRGERCEKLITACDSHPCLNNATCYSESVDNFNCSCLPGTLGNYCEVNIDECASNPCKNTATCIDQFNGYECLCLSGYSGILCELDIDECQSNPCQNGGVCKDLLDHFECLCPSGITGINCENDIDECLRGPCSGNGNCTNLIGSYHCTCFPGSTGKHCDLREPCFSSPCENNGTCSPLDTNATDDNYTCACVPGFNGTDCESDIDECAESRENLCRNGGSCINIVGSFGCDCPLGFTGPVCEIIPPTTIELDPYTDLVTTEDSKHIPTSTIDTGIVTTDQTELPTLVYSSAKVFESDASTASSTSSSLERNTFTTEGSRETETKDASTLGPTTKVTTTIKAKTTVSSSTTSKSTATTKMSTYITSPVINVTGTVLPSEDVSENTQVNSGESFVNGDNFLLVEQAHIPIALTTKRPTVDVVTDCVLIKIFGLNRPDLKPEENGTKNEICWLVYDTIPPPVADVDVSVTENRFEAYRWIVKTLTNLMPIAPRPTTVENESHDFLKKMKMLLNGFSLRGSSSADDKSTLNSQCLQVLIKTKRKGRGYFKNRPNHPYVRYFRTFKPLPRSLASKMILCKTPVTRISTTTTVRTTTNRRTTLITKLQTSTRASSSVTVPVKKISIDLSNLNNTHVQKKFYYPQRGNGHVEENGNVIAPRIVVTVYRSARKVFEVGSEKARRAYRETRILLHNTLRQLSTLWTTVHRLSNVVYAPVTYSKDLIAQNWNAAWVKARGAYSAARDVVHRAYQRARENFRNVYDILRNRASHLSAKYYQLYSTYYNNYTSHVNKAAKVFLDNYDNYTYYLTQYWKKYIKGEKNVNVVPPSYTGSVGRRRRIVK